MNKQQLNKRLSEADSRHYKQFETVDFGRALIQRRLPPIVGHLFEEALYVAHCYDILTQYAWHDEQEAVEYAVKVFQEIEQRRIAHVKSLVATCQAGTACSGASADHAHSLGQVG